MKHILGAGLAGLIAACHFKDAIIYEAAPEPIETGNHKALLRFRDDSVSTITGIPFKSVTVHKEICFQQKVHAQPNIRLANLYARKTTGVFTDRSIWNLEPSERFIAPPDFYEQLRDRHIQRIHWNTPFTRRADFASQHEFISTIPLYAMLRACGIREDLHTNFKFDHTQIKVDRYKLPPGTDLYQTVYFPDPALRIFRASVTGDIAILESLTDDNPKDVFNWITSKQGEAGLALHQFGFENIDGSEFELIDSTVQKHGKIVDMPTSMRQGLLYELTRDYNVFSLGRFATWRNILLDDVVKDIQFIERLMNNSSYGRLLSLQK